MAITRAQIVRQLYRYGGGADMGAIGGSANQGPAGGASAGGDYGGNRNPEQTYGGGDRNPGLETNINRRAAAEANAELERERLERERLERERLAAIEKEKFERAKQITQQQIDRRKQNLRNRLFLNTIDRNKAAKLNRLDQLTTDTTIGGIPLGPFSAIASSFNVPKEVSDFDVDSLREIASTKTTMGGSLSKSDARDIAGLREDFRTESQVGKGLTQEDFDEYLNKNINQGGGEGGLPAAPIIPLTTSPITKSTDQEPELTELQRLIAERGTPYRFMADGGIMNDDVIGGMADGNFDEMGRQMYGLGKLVKKATRAVKKIVKSPVGVAALGAYGFGLGPFSGIKGSGFLSNLFKGTGGTSFIDKLGGKAMLGILGASTLAGLTTPDEDEDQLTEEELRGPGLDIAAIRANPYTTKGQAYAFYADGGDVEKEPVAKKVMPLLDMDGKEKDYRETGGFVDIGRMERADDVPARLSKNEFVFTADAVRNAGDGDIDKGAEVMYNMMKNLENGGDVSEESQGLEGARKMFQTSQRLEEVL